MEKSEVPYRNVQAQAVLAMAHHQLKQETEARAALNRGLEIAETKLPKVESGDLGDKWRGWLVAHILLREAQSLLDTN